MLLRWAGSLLRFFVVAWWMARGAMRRALATAWPASARTGRPASTPSSTARAASNCDGCGPPAATAASTACEAATARAMAVAKAARAVSSIAAKEGRVGWPEGSRQKLSAPSNERHGRSARSASHRAVTARCGTAPSGA